MSEGWKSLRACKVPWTYEEVRALANAVISSLPQASQTLLHDHAFKGSEVLSTPDNGIHSRHVAKHAAWLRPVLEFSPRKVPPLYQLADTMMEMNRIVGGA
eukprot:12972693-Alexandrium_andersonii.AAC.1